MSLVPSIPSILSFPFLSFPFLSFPFLFSPLLSSPFLPLSLSTFLSIALHFSLLVSLSLSSTFSSVCSTPRAVFTHMPCVPFLHSIQAVCLIWQLWDSHWECLRSYRAVLALHAGAVEAQRRDTVADTLHVHRALVAPLARLRLGKVPGPQGDGSDLSGRNENFPRVKELRAVLWKQHSTKHVIAPLTVRKHALFFMSASISSIYMCFYPSVCFRPCPCVSNLY